MMEREVAMQVELRSFNVSCEMEKITSTPLNLSLYGFTHPSLLTAYMLTLHQARYIPGTPLQTEQQQGTFVWAGV